MSSQAQIEANRANAQLSQGPVSEAGKARSSQNARTHGITMNIANLEGDDLAAYTELLDALIAEFHPESPFELHCVREMAAAEWRLETVTARQEQLLGEPDLAPHHKTLALLLRYESAARRAFERAAINLRQHRNVPARLEKIRRSAVDDHIHNMIDMIDHAPMELLLGGKPVQLRSEPKSTPERL